jgi:mannonate dehydratase
MRIPGRENGPPAESATEEQLWDRWYRFMKDLLPVAEEAGVVLAAHPDDPPVERVRQQPKLGWNGERYLRIVEELDSPFNRLELCLGTLAEMADHDVYATVERAASRNRIGYIHFRNVVGSAPDYREVFLDEGELDVDRILRILKAAGYDGVMVPDHTPLLTCDAPWHAGMAYAMGYLKASIDRIRDEG